VRTSRDKPDTTGEALEEALVPQGDDLEPADQSLEGLTANAIWSQAAAQLRADLSEGNYSAWFGRAKPLRLDGNTFVLGVANPFAKQWIEDRFLLPLRDAVSQAAHRDLAIAILVDDSIPSEDASPPGASPGPRASMAPDPQLEDRPVLHPKYTFESFVIGSSNRFAHAAALAVAEAPAQAYNPLFIYGGAGLGKTHLLHAIGHYVRDFNPNLRARYVSTEEFMNDFISSLQRRTIPDFHRRYRATDLLLMDDIQFLEGKERTQEEFFHTFNSLHPRSQLIITSDRPPKKISTLEERLRTRFEWGLLTDIQPPDLETRLAILQKKTETEHLTVTPEVLSFIASRIQTNIRELEGALIRVTAYASLTRSEPSLELAKDVLESVLPNAAETRITTELIMTIAAEYFDVTPDDIKSANRTRPLVEARQMAMYLCRELTDLSLPKIGERFGGRDHSTVVHATTKVRSRMREREISYQQVRELTERIRQRAIRG
jgi:chromosomal replication initiator protein